MRKPLLLILCTIALTGCSLSQSTVEPTKINEEEIPTEHDYSEVASKQILWNNIFSVGLDDYFVYFYSANCSHCLEIKNEVIEYALNNNNFFFVKSTNKDVVTKDTKNTIGVSFVGDFSIIGYPSLAKIKDGKVVKNIGGKSQILSAIR